MGKPPARALLVVAVSLAATLAVTLLVAVPPADAAPDGGAPVVVQDGMVRIPEARFTMGTNDPRAPASERPERVVTAPAFWIDRTEVTVGAYRACVARRACVRPRRTSTACTYDLDDPDLPVSCVGWSAALAYCVAVGKRLPREVEWELAARGTELAPYPWGGAWTGCGQAITLVKDGVQRSCGKTGPLRVGSRPHGASPFGVLDMSGSVEEWVLDWYRDLTGGDSPASGASHVLRGGGWMTAPSRAKVTSRNWGSVLEAGPNVGFRCARDADGGPPPARGSN